MRYLILVLVLTACEPKYNCEMKTIKEVGGCDSVGNCGVITEDGQYYRDVQQPVKGQTRKLCEAVK